MRRRSVVRALLGTAGLASLSGCNALLGRDETGAEPSGSPTPDPSGSSPSRPATASGSDTAGADGPDRTTASPGREPYRAEGAVPLDRPRGLRVRNLGSRERFVTAVVSDGDTEVFADSVSVPAGGTASFPALVATAGQYDVLVETADGARKRYTWELRADLDDLWVDLTPQVSFRRPVLCLTDCPFAVADGSQSAAYDLPSDVDVAAALGRTPALAVDNDGSAPRQVRVHVWDAGRLHFASGFDLPPDVRLLVPVFPANRRYDVVVRTEAGEAIYDWQPTVRNTLYAAVSATPTFRCGYADHDVEVRNETDRAREVRVRVLTGDRTLFERRFTLDPNEVETVPSAVDPAGPFRFEVATGGSVERYNWVRCAPNGPITVAVSDRGVSVSVRPTRQSS